MEGTIYQLILVSVAVFLVFLNGFFVASEFSIVKVRSTRIEELIRQGKKRAIRARRLVKGMDEYLSATQLGITVASLGLGWIGEPAFAALFQPLLHWAGDFEPALAHSLAATCAFFLITFLHIVLGELAPKSLAIQVPEPVVMATAGPMIFFYRLTYPFIWSLNSTANFLLKMLGVRPVSEAEAAHSEEELRMILAHSHETGVLGTEEQRILERVFDFGGRLARQIMIPAGEVVYLDATRPFEENLQRTIKHQHTRYPLCEGALDRAIGIIHVKDLLWNLSQLGPGFDLRTIKRPVRFVPESTLIKMLLPEFRETRTHLSVVVDEFGSAVGVLSLEDILEELVGEIQDEFDAEVPTPLIQQQNDRRYLVNGRTLLAEVGNELELVIDDKENDTIAGHVMTLLGRTAEIGDEVTLAGLFRVRVVGMRNLQITDLLFEKIDDNSS